MSASDHPQIRRANRFPEGSSADPVAFAQCRGISTPWSLAGPLAQATFPSDTCKALIANPAKYVGDIAEDSAKDLYAMSERPTQPQVCEYAIDGKTFIVRDEGMLKVVGNVLCSGLAKRADRP